MNKNIADIIKITKSKSILCVDDEVGFLNTLGEVLSIFFKDVHLATNGSVALDIINLNIGKLDMILSDINMPIMNGLMLHKEIVKLNLDVPFIFISSNDDNSYAINNDIRFIQKPINMEKLANILAKYC